MNYKVGFMTRNEQKEERRKQILFKALELFVTKGFTETKITDIAQALDISTGLLLHQTHQFQHNLG